MGQTGPDKGWSWIIIICCAYLNLAFFGLVRSSGVMYVAFLHNYGVTREEASWPFSLCSAVFQLSGPVASVLMHYLTLRKACIIGSTIATIGVVCCYFADSILWVNIFYGVIHSIGFGIVATLVPLIVSQNFEKYRATAMGIAFSGGPISSFIFPPAIEFLLEKYDLAGTFLILGGIIMNTIVACSLLRPPSWQKKPNAKSPTWQKKPNAKSSKQKYETVSTKENMESKNSIQNLTLKNVKTVSEDHNGNADTDEDKHKNGFETTELPKQMEPLIKNDNNKTVVDTDNIERSLTPFNNAERGQNGNFKRRRSIQEDFNERRDSLPFLEAEEQISVISLRKGSVRSIKIKSVREQFCHAVSDVMNNPMFYILVLTLNICFLGLQCFFMVIIDFGKDKGIPEQEMIYVLFAFSLTDLTGRLSFGWITDKNFVKAKNFLILTVTSLGFLNQLYPIISHLKGIFVVATIHGLFVGNIIPLIFVLQIEYIGMERLPLALGLTTFINGVSTFLRPPMIGLFRDVIGTYDWMFHFMGFLYFLLAIVWIMEPWIIKLRKPKIHPLPTDEKTNSSHSLKHTPEASNISDVPV